MQELCQSNLLCGLVSRLVNCSSGRLQAPATRRSRTKLWIRLWAERECWNRVKNTKRRRHMPFAFGGLQEDPPR